MSENSLPRLTRDDWFALARKLDWEFSYVSEREVFPEAQSGTPWLEHREWQDWDEPYRTTYADYVTGQAEKEAAVRAVRESIGRVEDFDRHDRAWLSALKLHSATLPLAEFAAVVGNLRAARFGRDSAWRNAATFGALDELRHTQIPLLVMHELVRWDRQFDWTHKLLHTNNWVAIASRHLIDELLLSANPIEFAVGTHFVFESGFTNLQFVGLSSVARGVGDRMFEKVLQSIQTDEARHAQIGGPVLRALMEKDPEYAQWLVDKWFWRSWLLFSIVTGFAMDYLTPLEHRKQSFKELMEEWILDQFQRLMQEYGVSKPWYWDQFLQSLDYYHHMVYASAYTYRATVWFDFALPGPAEREWLARKYPSSWPELAPVWDRLSERWRRAGPGVEWYTHGATPIGFCDLCQLVLSGGTPQNNTARVRELGGRKHVFCSEPCEKIFTREPERYQEHKSVVQRILAGEAPGNVLELARSYFDIDDEVRGRDVKGGAYGWLKAGSGQPPFPVAPKRGSAC